MMQAEQPQSNAVRFQDTTKPLAETLIDVADSLPEDNISVRYLLSEIGEQGILLLCIIMVLPFMTPLAIPGVSTVFGLIIMLIGIGVILNRLPWLPGFVLDRPIPSKSLGAILRRGSGLVKKIERFLRPRIPALTHRGTINRINGIALLWAGFVLILPFPIIPFSNFFPGLAILLLAIGMLTRDGVFVVLGYILTVVATVYLFGIVIAAVLGGAELASMLREPTATPMPTPSMLFPFLFR